MGSHINFSSVLLALSSSSHYLRSQIFAAFLDLYFREFLSHHPTAPEDLPTILLNSTLGDTITHFNSLGYYPSFQILAALRAIYHATWLRHFATYLCQHADVASLISTLSASFFLLSSCRQSCCLQPSGPRCSTCPQNY